LYYESGWDFHASSDCMDLYKTITELRARRDQLQRIISQLEELRTDTSGSLGVKRRGRKFMGAEERAEVSRRMKQYWATRAKKTKERTAV
jgi:hypothetical protein